MNNCAVVGKMTYLDNSPVRGPSSPWSDLRRRCSQKQHLQKRYWCFWIVAALFPFTLLRTVYLCNISSMKDKMPNLSGAMMESEERVSLRHQSIISIRSPDIRHYGARMSSPSHKSPLSRSEETSWSTLLEQVKIESNQLKNQAKKSPKKKNKRKSRKSKEKQSSGQSMGTGANVGHLGLPENNVKSISVVENQEERPIGEHLIPQGDIVTFEENKLQVGEPKEKPQVGHRAETPDEGYLGLPEDNDRIDSVPFVLAEKHEQQQEEQEEVSIGEQEIPPENIAPSIERHNSEAKDHWTRTEEAPPAEERTLTRSESEDAGTLEQKLAEEQKGVNELGEAEKREGNEEKAMELGTEQIRTAEELKSNDDRRKAVQEEVVAEIEVEERMEEEILKNIEAIEERREEEELKDAEGIEREMVEEQIHATEKEKEKEEETHQDSGSILQEVTDHTQSEKLEELKPEGQCDLFEGDWEWDPEGPLYTNSTCFYMQSAQSCLTNGRPDTDYLHWKWKPRDCDLPRFDARAFLEAFKGKTLGFVGDSLARNQMQSLLCMLSQIEIPKMMYQSHDDTTVLWLYEQHNVTLSAVWSPYLLKESNEGIMGFEKGQSVLYLDALDSAWTSVMQDFDIIVLSIGQWYFKGSIYVKQDKVVGCHYCPGHKLREIGHQEAYQGAVCQVLEKVASEFKGIAIMSTFALSHFEDGPWDKGGQCRREKPLNKEESLKFPGVHNEMHDIVMSEFNRISHDKSKVNEDVRLEFLDVTKVSLTRADGHPGPYRHPYPYEGKNPDEWVPNDCLHWCLPGPVDTWNQLLVKIAHRHL